MAEEPNMRLRRWDKAAEIAAQMGPCMSGQERATASLAMSILLAFMTDSTGLHFENWVVNTRALIATAKAYDDDE